jgi:hypothetical protein
MLRATLLYAIVSSTHAQSCGWEGSCHAENHCDVFRHYLSCLAQDQGIFSDSGHMCKQYQSSYDETIAKCPNWSYCNCDTDSDLGGALISCLCVWRLSFYPVTWFRTGACNADRLSCSPVAEPSGAGAAVDGAAGGTWQWLCDHFGVLGACIVVALILGYIWENCCQEKKERLLG